MASNESSSVPARLKDLKDSVKERFLGLLGIRQPKVLLEDEQEVFLQVGRTVWHAPRQLRIELWLSSLARRHSLVSEYQTYLVQDITREASVDIEKDVQRTFPNTRRFHAEEGQAQLRNVLRAYAAYDPEVAYCQGMNFLTGLLLMYMPTEAHAFAALVVLMEDRKLRSFYHRSMALLQVQLWQLSRLISPSLNQHLEALGVVPMLYGASWLMTAFSADFPIPFSARIMDVLLADQCECALLKVAAALMKGVEQRLHAMSDLEDVLGHLKIEVPGWDEEELHDLLTAAFTKPWTTRQLTILRSTEGAETVAQAMDRVMNMNEQLSVQACDDDDGADDGEVGDARVAVTIPRIQPPPQPPNSFAASPACGTPINGGIHGTGSHGGAATACSPPAPTSASNKCSSSLNSGSNGGAAGGGAASGLLLLQGASTTGSPAVWGIPCIHPNVPASPAIQAFRRAHLPCLHAAVTVDRNGHPAQHAPLSRANRSGLCNSSSHDDAVMEGDDEDGAFVLEGDSGADGQPGGGGGGCTHEEWGEFNAAAVARQHWRSMMRAAPGTTRHVLMHSEASYEVPWQGSSIAAAGAGSSSSQGGAPPPPAAPGPSREPSSGSQPIPVPGSGTSSRGGGGGSGTSAFATAAAAGAVASGRPPLPPRCASFDRGPASQGSRLSVVSEDSLAVQMGPVAPAPSPRGSMDMHVLGRSGSQQLESCENYGLLLCDNSFTGAAGGGAGMGGGPGSASCNGDCASGSASATTAGALLSPSGISGAVSPHAASPKVLSGWSVSGGGHSGGGAGSDTPTAGYVPLGMERTASGSLYDPTAGGFLDRSVSLVTPFTLPPLLVPPPPPPAATGGEPWLQSEQPTDMATDIAGDILRMLSAVDTGNANAAYDPRAILGESMYADSPNKEEHKLVRRGSDVLRHFPSSSALAEIAAQDLAKAQEEAERMRQELEAQLQQQRAAERGTSQSSGTAWGHGIEAAEVAATGAGGESHGSDGAREGQDGSSAAAENGDAAAVDAPPGGTAGTGGGAERELVFKRPTLYVDGIPMFDPKSLMTDSSEAQVMFTPTVSPGASSYADPLLAGFTPTGDAGTPGDADLTDAAIADTWRVPPESAAASDGGEEADEALQAAAQVSTGDEDAGAPAPPAGAADGEGDGGRPAEPAAVGQPLPRLPNSPSASEWVDWSQAPPIQAAPAVVVPASETGEAEDDDVAVEGDLADADDEAPPSPLQPSGCSGIGSSTAGPEEARSAPASMMEHDLIDMASPARPLQPGFSSRAATPVSASFTSGTGLSPVPALAPSPMLQPTQLSRAEVVGDATGERQMPYGLLPMASSLTHRPPLAPCISFASSSAAAQRSSSFVGSSQSHLMGQLRCDLQRGSEVSADGSSRHWDGAAAAALAAVAAPDGVINCDGGGDGDGGALDGGAPHAMRQKDSLTFDVGGSDAAPQGDAGPPATPSGGNSDGAQAMECEADRGLEILAGMSVNTAAAPEAEVAAGSNGMALQLGHPEELTTPVAGAGLKASLEHHGSCEMEGAEEVEQSPFRAALSPSLASHIMSAYLRSEQHQQQQEQRELEERLQQEHDSPHQLNQQHLAASGPSSHSCGGSVTDVVVSCPLEAAVGPGLPAVPGSLGFTSQDAHHASQSQGLGSVGQFVVEELTLCAVVSASGASGMASPVLGSPSRFGGPAVLALAAPASSAPCLHTKTLTPFAVSMSDPSMCRLSAEVMQAMPASLMLQPDTPTPPSQLFGSGGVQTADSRGSLRCTGSGDCGGDVSISASGIGCLGSLAGIAGSSSIHALGIIRPPSAGGAQQLAMSLGSLDAAAGCHPSTHATASILHPMLGHACSARISVSSNGGAMPPLLPPPPPPQVPLCQTTVRPELPSAPSAPASSQPQPLPPVLCSSSATVLCVNAATAAGTPAAAGAAAALPLPPQAQPPSWTATFDGVDDPPAAAASEDPASRPRSLSTAFAVEDGDMDTPPMRARHSFGGTTTNGVCTPEARLHTPDMARGMSIEAAPQRASHQQQPWDSPQAMVAGLEGGLSYLG